MAVPLPPSKLPKQPILKRKLKLELIPHSPLNGHLGNRPMWQAALHLSPLGGKSPASTTTSTSFPTWLFLPLFDLC